MSSHEVLQQQNGGWFQEGGPNDDVALSSRIRLSRNLMGYAFPGSMSPEEEKGVQDRLIEAFSHLHGDSSFHVLPMEQLSPSEGKLLLEKKMISRSFAQHREKTVLLQRDMTCSCMINEVDHLRILVFRGGNSLKALYGFVRSLDEWLDQYVDFAASLEFGYLGPKIDNLGTAMKGTVMLHLSGLVETGLIEKTKKAVLEEGFEIEGTFDNGDEYPGQYYLVSNRETMGFREEEILEKLGAQARKVISCERMARENLLNKRRWMMEDRVFRAEGIVRNCRLLPYNEGAELISSLRQGVILGWIDTSLEDLGSLLILSQRAHILERLTGEKDPGKERVDRERAQLFREVLFPPSDKENPEDV